MEYNGDDTAVMVAAAREIATRSDDVIHDPYAGDLVRAAGGLDLSQFPEDMVDRVVTSVTVRTHFLDGVLATAIERGVLQIVLLGAGLDARPWRLNLPADTRTWLVDLPTTAGVTEQVLGAPKSGSVTTVEADLRNPRWADELAASGFRADQPTVWIAEGLLFYLDSDVATAAVTQAGYLSSPGSMLGFAHFGPASAQEAMSRDMSRTAGTYGSEFVSTIRTCEQFLENTGWSVDSSTTIAREAERLGQHVKYGEVPGEEVTWLCEASRESPRQRDR
jgi:methyltransferase (TIGR00027 family)